LRYSDSSAETIHVPPDPTRNIPPL
jgi:hypothetical protein